jgi:glyoxylase-like metal-dependent hydrolase (beta-lactamase superfamily II)
MSKPVAIRLALVALTLAGLWTALTQNQQAPVELTVEKIADDLHVIVGGGGNVAVYDTPEGVILIDDKFDQHVEQILAKVKTVTSQPVRYVLNTHQHGDHTGGNKKLMAQGAEIIIHRNARANMVAGSMPGLPRITFSDETAVYLGNKEVHAQYFGRGHTNGDVVISFPARRTIHTGDLFTAGAPFIDYSANGSGVAWTETLAAAMKLDFDTVIPGHGPIMKKADLAKYIQNIETVRNRINDLRKQGKSKEDVAQLIKIDDLGWQPSPFFSQRSLPGLYDELAR